MKKYVKGILIFSVAISMAALALAEELMQYEGVVSNINTISNTFVLKTKKEDVTIEVRPMSRVMINGERKSLNDVRSGDEVKCTSVMKGDSHICKELTVTPKK